MPAQVAAFKSMMQIHVDRCRYQSTHRASRRIDTLGELTDPAVCTRQVPLKPAFGTATVRTLRALKRQSVGHFVGCLEPTETPTKIRIWDLRGSGFHV